MKDLRWSFSAVGSRLVKRSSVGDFPWRNFTTSLYTRGSTVTSFS